MRLLSFKSARWATKPVWGTEYTASFFVFKSVRWPSAGTAGTPNKLRVTFDVKSVRQPVDIYFIYLSKILLIVHVFFLLGKFSWGKKPDHKEAKKMEEAGLQFNSNFLITQLMEPVIMELRKKESSGRRSTDRK